MELISDNELIADIGSNLHACLGRFIYFVRSDGAKRAPPGTVERLRKELQATHAQFSDCFTDHEKCASKKVAAVGESSTRSGEKLRACEDSEMHSNEGNVNGKQCGTCGARVDVKGKGKEREHHQPNNTGNVNSANELSAAVANKPSHRHRNRDQENHAQNIREVQGQQVFSTQVTLTPADIQHASQSHNQPISFNIQISMLGTVAGSQDDAASVVSAFDQDNNGITTEQAFPRMAARSFPNPARDNRDHMEAAPVSSASTEADRADESSTGPRTDSGYSDPVNSRDDMDHPPSSWQSGSDVPDEPVNPPELSMGFPEETVRHDYLFLTRVPLDCEDSHILSQCTGGKIERIVILPNHGGEGTGKRFKCALLAFVDPAATRRFIEEAGEGFALPDFPNSRVEVAWGDRECYTWKQAIMMANDPEINATRVLTFTNCPGRIDPKKLIEGLKCGNPCFGGLERMEPLYRVERDGEIEYGARFFFNIMSEAIKAKLSIQMDPEYSGVVVTYDKDYCDREWIGLLTPIRRGHDNSLASQRRDRELRERWEMERLKALKAREERELERERQRVLARMKLELGKSNWEKTGAIESGNDSDEGSAADKEDSENSAEESNDEWDLDVFQQQQEAAGAVEQSNPISETGEDLNDIGEGNIGIWRPEDNSGDRKWNANTAGNQREDLESRLYPSSDEEQRMRQATKFKSIFN